MRVKIGDTFQVQQIGQWPTSLITFTVMDVNDTVNMCSGWFATGIIWIGSSDCQWWDRWCFISPIVYWWLFRFKLCCPLACANIVVQILVSNFPRNYVELGSKYTEDYLCFEVIVTHFTRYIHSARVFTTKWHFIKSDIHSRPLIGRSRNWVKTT